MDGENTSENTTNITRTPCWVRGGKPDEIAWIGRDTLAWCSGLYIVFLHVTKRQEALRWCWNDETSDGACHIAGHVSAPVFAFAERSLNPRIFVHAYPSMTKLSECSRGCESGYLAIAFTPYEHLVSLGSYPSFPLIVWCWRTGQRIALVDTPVRDEIGQTIHVTPSGRTVIGQVGKTCGDLLTWELDVVGDLVILKDHAVRLPEKARAQGIAWCPSELVLAITDQEGHVYLSKYDGTDVRRIVFSQRCGICQEMEIPAVCWFRDGIVLKTTFCQVRYFRRQPQTDTWFKQWHVTTTKKPYILVAHPFRTEWLFYYTLEGYLMQIAFTEEEISSPMVHEHLHHGGTYRFVDFVRPWCHHLVVTDDLRDLMVLETYGGGEVVRLELDMEGVITGQASHPDYPMIVVVSDHGEIVFVGLTDPEAPIVIARYRLQRKALNFVRFSNSGRFVIAAHKEIGNCYCVSVHRDRPWVVMAQVITRRRLADVMLMDDRTNAPGYLKLIVLFIKYELYSPVGEAILVYDTSRPEYGFVDERRIVSTITLPGLVRELSYMPGNTPYWLFIGSPYLERELHVLKLHTFTAELVDAMMSGHHVRLPRISTDRHWIVTCAYDGLVIVRDETVSTVVSVVPAHHRLDSGTARAIVNRNGDMMVALGRNGSLVTVRLSKQQDQVPSTEDTLHHVDRDYYERQKQRILNDYASLHPVIRLLLARRLEQPVLDKTWEEIQQDLQLQREVKRYAGRKAFVMRELSNVKATVKELMDTNETLPEMQQLPIAAFDVDRAGRDQKLKVAKDEREEMRLEFEYLCESMVTVTKWIKSTFWDTQIILGRSIFTFCGETEVTNYPTLPLVPHFQEHLQYAQFCHHVEQSIVYGDMFQTWRAYTDEELQAELRKPLMVFHKERRMKVLLEEEEREIDPEELEELKALDGMTTNNFIEQSPHYYSQMEAYGLAHATQEERYLMHDCHNLQLHFNALFNNKFAAKEREMAVIKERNDRIRYIDSELRVMFGETVPRIPADPKWHPKEKVESIIHVEDHEVKAKPYVSPSQQEILDRQAAEAERTRLLLLADDFHERALMRMMDGVLEVRWEDTIKVDVRKPACMLEKTPDKFTVQDILAVKKYEAEVESLRQERERYKRMLEADYVKISALRKEGIEKFDARVNEIFQLRLSIDSAINQLKLKHIRGRLRNLERIRAIREDDRMKREISETSQRQTVLEGHAQRMNDTLREMVGQLEALGNREKILARRMHHDFASLSKSAVDALERQFRRKPRLALRNIIARDLMNLASCIVDATKPAYLPADCVEYLKILEGLDARPTELPASIDAPHWNHLVRLRHQKLDVELRQRARQLEVAAVERTIGVYEGKIEACRSGVAELRERLRQAREERVMRERNQELQLVLKLGQVEIEMRGERRDAAHAVLVPRNEIHRVNEHIRAAGARKLDALRRMIEFRHKLAATEWEHRCLRTRFKDLEDDMHFLDEITVTRDMRLYLKRKAKGLRDDKTAVQLEKEMENARSSLENMLAREMSKLDNIREKIARTRKKNSELDRAILQMNVRRWELEYQRDYYGEMRESEHVNRKMQLFKQRAELVRKVQDNYAELLTLQTEHELLRMSSYPILDFFEKLDKQTDKERQ